MRRSSTEKDVTTLVKEIRRSSTEKDVATLVREMRHAEKDVPTLVKGGSEGTSFPARRNSSRLQERRKSLPVEELQNDIQKMYIERSKTSHHRSRSNSSKS